MSWLLEGVGFVNCLVPTESSEYTTSSSGGPISTGRSTNLAQLARHNPSSHVISYLWRPSTGDTNTPGCSPWPWPWLLVRMFHLRYYRTEQMWLLALLLTAFARPVLTRDVSTPTWEVSCFGLIVVGSGQPSFAAWCCILSSHHILV